MDNNNFLIVGGIGLLVISIAAGQGDRQTLSHQSQQSATAAISQEIESEYRNSQKQIAESRYESGLCLASNQLITLGLAVANIVPNGSIVCDRAGMTAVINKQGKLIQFAKTNDQEIILEGLK